MTKQSLALSKIATSTWGATFAKARHVYSAVVRPAMSYGSAVWHSLPEHNNLPKIATSKVSVIQNKCLGVVLGAYKATPIQVLEAETYVPPMSLYLKHLQIKARYRLRVSEQSKFIAKSCKKIADKLKNQRGRTRRVTTTPGQRKYEWAGGPFRQTCCTPIEYAPNPRG